MTGTRKTVLLFGLLNQKSTVDTVENERKKADAANFDTVPFAVKPDDDQSVEEARTLLRSRHWDGVLIGFGVRGQKELTPTFELMVNMVLEEVKPVPKMLFSKTPDDVFGAIQRAFPEAE